MLSEDEISDICSLIKEGSRLLDDSFADLREQVIRYSKIGGNEKRQKIILKSDSFVRIARRLSDIGFRSREAGKAGKRIWV